MLELHQREGCPDCAQVRRFLELHQISYVAVPVAKLGSERRQTLEMVGNRSAEVPLLVDGDQVIQGSGPILDYLAENHGKGSFADPRYGLTRRLPGVSFEDAISRSTKALADEGFGILTEIDVRATLKKKLDVDFPNYKILGACNPPLAHKALSAEPGIGLLLPCNVVVAEDADGTAVVSAIDPIPMFSVVGRPSIEPLAKEVRAKLARALAAV